MIRKMRYLNISGKKKKHAWLGRIREMLLTIKLKKKTKTKKSLRRPQRSENLSRSKISRKSSQVGDGHGNGNFSFLFGGTLKDSFLGRGERSSTSSSRSRRRLNWTGERERSGLDEQEGRQPAQASQASRSSHLFWRLRPILSLQFSQRDRSEPRFGEF